MNLSILINFVYLVYLVFTERSTGTGDRGGYRRFKHRDFEARYTVNERKIISIFIGLDKQTF